MFGLSSKKNVVSPVQDILGSPLIVLEGTTGNVFVHDRVVVLDFTSGVLNVTNREFKVLPIKNITAVTIRTVKKAGFILFSTSGDDLTSKDTNIVNKCTNCVGFSSDESALKAQEILTYLLPKII